MPFCTRRGSRRAVPALAAAAMALAACSSATVAQPDGGLASPTVTDGLPRTTVTAGAVPTAPPVTGTLPIEVVPSTRAPVGSTTSTGKPPCKAFTISRAWFDTDATTPPGDLRGALTPVVEELNRLGGTWRVDVIGHTDHRSTTFPGGNQALSERRAQTVADGLVAAGLDRARLRTVAGRAADQPVAEGDSPEALAANRRVEVLAEC